MLYACESWTLNKTIRKCIGNTGEKDLEKNMWRALKKGINGDIKKGHYKAGKETKCMMVAGSSVSVIARKSSKISNIGKSRL